jgi:hypothetical protein
VTFLAGECLRYKEEGDILEGLMALDEGMAWQRWQRAG